jgi:hypothetical protein
MVVKKVLRKLKALCKLVRTKFILKKEKVPNWFEYYRKKDPLFDRQSILISQKYELYPYKVILTPKFKEWQEAITWCYYNCNSKFRSDIFPVHRQYRLDKDKKLFEEFLVNYAAHEEILIVAFTDEKDYVWFSLKWL